MKSSVIATLAMVALLAFSSVSFAQDESAPPAADSLIGDAVQLTTGDSQESVSDSLVVGAELAPVADGAVFQNPVTSDCTGCGAVAVPTPSGCGGCSSGGTTSPCGVVQTSNFVQPSSCGSCGGIGQVNYEQPLYQTIQATTTPAPMSQAVVNPAPQPAPVVTSAPMAYSSAPMTSSCSSCGNAAPAMTTYPAPVVSNYSAPVATTSGCSTCGTTPSSSVSTGCTNCPQRGRVRGRIFSRR